MIVVPTDFQWANETGAHGMPRIDECLADGWEKVQPHPFYPTSWLLKRAVPKDDDIRACPCNPTRLHVCDRTTVRR